MSPEERKRRNERIRNEYKKTGSIRKTCCETGHSRKLVRKVLRGEEKPRQPPRSGRPKRPSKLDPYKAHLRALILDDDLTAILALGELQAMGFDGGYSIVKDFVQTIRPSSKTKATTVVEHPPGDEGQMDWSPYGVAMGADRFVVHAFSVVLPHSRWMFVRFALDEKFETLLRLHDEMFDALGAVPQRLTYDNMTTVGRHVGPNEVWINPRFEVYANEMDFEVHITDPGCPNQHASVERPMDYIENNCLRRRRFRFDDLDDLNRHAQWWCDEVANVRIHGTTRRRPIDLLRYERSFLKPLPSARPEPFRLLSRIVRTDFCVAVNTNGYSVSPHKVGKDATVRLFAERLEILIEGELHCAHALCTGRHQRVVLPEHEAEFKNCAPRRRLLEQAFLRLGPAAEDYYEGLRTQRGRGAGYHLKRILQLADRHSATVVTAAMAHAARFGSYGADAVAGVIAGRTLPREHSTPTSEVPMPPDRVRRWLEGMDVEESDLGDYDDLVDRHGEDEDDQEA
jgi:transposase